MKKGVAIALACVLFIAALAYASPKSLGSLKRQYLPEIREFWAAHGETLRQWLAESEQLPAGAHRYEELDGRQVSITQGQVRIDFYEAQSRGFVRLYGGTDPDISGVYAEEVAAGWYAVVWATEAHNA